ncbi:MAG: fumarylacetoacetate hydrolase family protein [Deltaproteobacteria bacterium]|nr:fumarylacetoacetate hydrolase family protein [Deltaproteobacteria bacterium]
MRIANVRGRLMLLGVDDAIDVAQASGGRFSAEPQAVYAEWEAFRAWAATARRGGAVPIVGAELGPPSPRPAQVFGIGLNYTAHAAEAGLPVPDRLPVFTKFPTCLAGPNAEIVLPSGAVDWEVELVVVIGTRAYRVAEAAAWDHVAGLAVGQDVSERVVQWSGGGQFSMGKSFPTFGPFGPYLVTPDELPNRDDLAIRCWVNDELMQESRTSDMVFSVARIIEGLSAVLPLLPGDVIFTGTPSGIGASRKPPRFLQPGDVVRSEIEGLGGLGNRCVAG